jgi:hypothetical protein
MAEELPFRSQEVAEPSIVVKLHIAEMTGLA